MKFTTTEERSMETIEIEMKLAGTTRTVEFRVEYREFCTGAGDKADVRISSIGAPFAARVSRNGKAHRVAMEGYLFDSLEEAAADGYVPANRFGDCKVYPLADGRFAGVKHMTTVLRKAASIFAFAEDFEGTRSASEHNGWKI